MRSRIRRRQGACAIEARVEVRMSGSTILVIVLVVIFLGGMVGLLLYANGGKAEKDEKGPDSKS